MRAYLMELFQGTSQKTGRNYTKLVLMNEQGRRQDFFADDALAKEIVPAKADLISPSLQELVPLEVEIDPFSGRLISVSEA